MGKSAVKVYVRFRPTANPSTGIDVQADKKTVTIALKKDQSAGLINNQQESLTFKYDQILQNASQETIYNTCAHEVVDSVIEGLNGTIMAYGQTGAGKTYTMSGDTSIYNQRGIVPRAINHIFREIDMRVDRQVVVKASYLEIYNEVFYDLLSDDPGHAHEQLSVMEEQNANGTAVGVRGITKRAVASEEEALSVFFMGENGRATSQHVLNSNSSRSHCIFTLHLETLHGGDDSERCIVSKLHCVDLAGSERTKKTQVTGTTLAEAMYINKSLTFLEQTVNALSKKESHVPFRQTKLTSVLKDALGGNCKTVMVATGWGEDAHTEETVSTLRFAGRVRTLTTTPVLNESNDPALLVRKYERQIRELKQELAMRDTFAGRGRVTYVDYTDMEKHELNQKVRKYLGGEEDIESLAVDSIKQVNETFKQFKACYSALKVELEEQLAKKAPAAPEAKPETPSVQEGGKEEVGDLDKDADGFHVGQAPAGAAPEEGEMANPKTPDVSDPKAAGDFPPPPGPEAAAQAAGASSPGPLSKNAAFVAYKHQEPAGRAAQEEIARASAALRDAKAALKEASVSVNASKGDIDRLTGEIKFKEDERGPAGGGEGEEVVDEEEYKLRLQLRESKAAYRGSFDALKAAKTGVDQATMAAGQARHALIDGFEEWWAQTRGAGLAGGAEAAEELLLLDPSEQFDRMEMERILSEDPESSAFYAARKHVRRAHPASAGAFGGEKGRSTLARKRELY